MMVLLTTLSYAGDVAINEVMYFPPDNPNNEWIEIYNLRNYTVNLSNWKLYDNSNKTLFPNSTELIPANSYAIISEDITQFLEHYPFYTGLLFEVTSLTLSDSGELLALYNSSGALIDKVNYSNTWGGSKNYSIELINPYLDNNNKSNWNTTLTYLGTPGSINSVFSPIICFGDIDCDDDNVCTDDECISPATIDSYCGYTDNNNSCDDGLYCTVNDICDGGECEGTDDRNCSEYNLPLVKECGHSPDNNPFTFDYFEEFTSECNETLDKCITIELNITHSCDIDDCGAECEVDEDCSKENNCSVSYNDFCNETKLTEYDNDKILDFTLINDSCIAHNCSADCTCLNCSVDCSPPQLSTYCVKGICGAGCDGNSDCQKTECDSLDSSVFGCYNGTYRDYNDALNTCQTEGDCSCTNNSCTNYTITITDSDGDGYDIECDNDCNDTNSNVNPNAAELCNGIDDDCDSSIDEELTRNTTCGVGKCSNNTGSEKCSLGGWVNNTCNPLQGASLESCDGLIDEDCDGSIDEGCDCTTGSNRNCSLQQGVCSGSTEICNSEGKWPGCAYSSIPDYNSTDGCDGIDNDCDGEKDEDYIENATSCGIGGCAANGSLQCINGTEMDSCTAGQPKEEIGCDGIDNNCDGSEYCSLEDVHQEGGSERTGEETSCTGLWECSDWSPELCPSSGTQERVCADKNNCGTGINKPSEKRHCFYSAPEKEAEERKEIDSTEDIDKNEDTDKNEEALTAAKDSGEEEEDYRAAAEKPGRVLNKGILSITGAAVGAAYREEPLTIGLLAGVVVAIIGIFGYVHLRNEGR